MFYKARCTIGLELMCFAMDKSFHTFKSLISKNLFNNSMHPGMFNAKRGGSLAQILHSTYAVILKPLLGSGLRLYFEQFRKGDETANLIT